MFVKFLLKVDLLIQLSGLLVLLGIGSYAYYSKDNFGWTVYFILMIPLISWQLFSSILHLIIAPVYGTNFFYPVKLLRYFHLTLVVLGIFFFILLYYIFTLANISPLLLIPLSMLYTGITALDLVTRRTNNLKFSQNRLF